MESYLVKNMDEIRNDNEKITNKAEYTTLHTYFSSQTYNLVPYIKSCNKGSEEADFRLKKATENFM